MLTDRPLVCRGPMSVPVADGAVIDRFDIAHDDPAYIAMARRLRTSGVKDVAIERGDCPVVTVLLEAGFSVFMLPNWQIKY